MLQQDLEQRLISSIINEKAFSEILTNGISTEDFIIHSEEFSFIQKYFTKYNSIPSKVIIESSFPGFTFIEGVQEHEIKFLCDELIKSTVRRKTINILNNSADTLNVDTYGTIESLINKLSNIKKPTSHSKSFADADALNRYKKALEISEKKSKGVINGIKTGISFFDDKYLGWQPGNLIGVVGRLGVGKSTLAQYLACQAYQSGKRVLFISPEMSAEEVNLKFDTFMGRINGYSFLNDKLQTGEINLKDYKEWVNKISKRKDWLTLDSANGKKFNIGNITGFVQEFSPDLVIVDGVPLLEGIGNESWLKMADVSYGLKSMSQNNKVVTIATSQANRAVGDEMPRPDQVSFGDAFMQACDCGIFIQSNVNKPLIRYITIPKRRMGKAINTPIEIQFDINQGIFSI